MADTDELVAHGIRPAETGREPTNKPTPRVRSRVACRACNHRKVRCDVTRTGIPCSNCLHEVATCEVLPRKKHRPRRPRTTLPPSQSKSKDGSIDQIASPAGHASRIDGDTSPTLHNARESNSQFTGTPNEQTLLVSENSPVNVGDARDPGLAGPVDVDEVLPDDSSLSYIGDRRGTRFFVYDLCHPKDPQDATPYLRPKESGNSWKPHEVEYLRQQGAFDILPDDFCDELIRCYFHHVHFFLPVVDAASFLTEYANNGRQNISLLLFWSMLLAAANYVESDVLQRAGFLSRKAVKTAMYKRAKSLYDVDHGTDKLVLIQSVILMGFWYSDPQEHTGASYWIGIAITLSQTLGLHRCPRLDNRSQRLPESQQPLIRRIWWSCVVRDRWLSLAKGRPMRIHQEDCDIPSPEAEDILNDLSTIPIETKQRFIPSGSETLAKMWIRLVEISTTLGRILRIHYRVNGPKPSAEDIDNSAKELQYCKLQEFHNDDTNDLIRLHGHHVELFYEATVAVLYRPYVFGKPTDLPFEGQSPWEKMALDKARTSASNTNAILEKIIDLNAVHFLKPMMITTIIPAMQIHLFDCKSTAPLRRGLASNKLSLCMLILSQLRDTYWSASVIYRLFSRAQAILDKSNISISTQIEKPSGNLHHKGAQPGTDTSDHNLEKKDPQSDRALVQDFSHLPIQHVPESNTLLDNQAAPIWMNDSPCFNNVDQLLSPGFSISENAFQSLFTTFDNDMDGVYHQIMPIPNDVPGGMLYNV